MAVAVLVVVKLLLLLLESEINVHAAGQVRLVNGNQPFNGLLEVRETNHDEWGTVCDYSFDQKDAIVVCRMLGYNDLSQANKVTRGLFGQGTGEVLLATMYCDGTETNLWDCNRGIMYSWCTHTYDVGVTCAAPGGTGCIPNPPCPDVSKCPFNTTEVVKVPHRTCPICRCASCPDEPPCPENCKSGETEYYQGVHCRRCRCVPQDLPDVIEEPNSISVALLVAVCVIALGGPLVCLVIVLIFRKKQLASMNKPRLGKDTQASKQAAIGLGQPGGVPRKTKVELTIH